MKNRKKNLSVCTERFFYIYNGYLKIIIFQKFRESKCFYGNSTIKKVKSIYTSFFLYENSNNFSLFTMKYQNILSMKRHQNYRGQVNEVASKNI